MTKVLVVDDRPTNRQVLSVLLAYAGHEVVEAGDGAAALAAARAERPDLVVTDLLMPTMDGYEFVQRMRADPELAGIPVIFYTATYRQREALSLAATCGVSRVITKPAEPMTILRAVAEALGQPMPDLVPAGQAERGASQARSTTSFPDATEERLESFMVGLRDFEAQIRDLDRKGPESLADRERLLRASMSIHDNGALLAALCLRLSGLSELSLKLMRERDPRRLMDMFCQAAQDLLPSRYAGLVLLEEDGRTIRDFLTHGLEARGTGHPPPDLDLPPLSRIRAERGPLRVSGPAVRYVLDCLGPALAPERSFLGTAIASPTQLYGLVYLADRLEAEEFSFEDEQLLVALAAQVAMHYENLNLYEIVQAHDVRLQLEMTQRRRTEGLLARRAHVAAFVADIRLAFNRSCELPEVLQSCTQAMVDHLDAAFARIWMLNEREKMLELGASAGMYTHLDGEHGRVPVGRFDIGVIAQDRRAHLTNNVRWDARVGDQEWARREGMVAFAGYPLVVGDRLMGVVAMFARKELDEFALEALGAVADELAREINRRVSEAQLRESEERFRQLVENMVQVFWMTTADFETILYVSPAYEAVWGRSTNELYDNPLAWVEAIHPDDREMALRETMKHKDEGKPYTMEYRIVRPDGTERWIYARGMPIRNADGKITRFAGIAEDISERRSLGEQLRQAQKMEAIGMLAGGVAHDFNNLLTVIGGHSDLAQMRLRQEDPLRRDLEEISAAVDRASSLTRQLLAFSRKQVVQPRVIDLNDVIRNLEKMLRRLIGEDIELTSSLHPALGRVMADPGQIEQVVLNLVVNARDAMPRGGKLTIETSNVELDETYSRTHIGASAGRHSLLAVTDNGCGMDAATRARIFEPFFTTKAERGTGLGLSTVYGIVRQSGGLVSCYSEPGTGTTLKVYLPFVQEEAERTSVKPVVEASRCTGTILLVEDEAMVRGVARKALEMGGYEVLEAAGGEEALRLCERHEGPIALMMTDVVMPGIGGRELADCLAPLRPGMPVLYSSGYTDDAVVVHGVLASDMAFIQKPYRPTALLQKVRETIAASEARTADPSPESANERIATVK